MTGLSQHQGLDPTQSAGELAARGPVYWDDGMKAWVVTRYAECLDVARNEDVFETPWRQATGGSDVLGRYGLYILRGTEHRGVHAPLHRWFEANSGAPIADMVRRHFDDLVAECVPPSGSFEFISTIAEPLPGRVILEVMGLPVTDELRLRLVQLNAGLHEWFATFGDDPDVLTRCLVAIADAEDLMMPTIRARRDAPTDDLLSAIWRIGRSQFDDWDERDVAKYATFFFGAGTVNSSNLMASVAATLLTRPDLASKVATDPRKIPGLVEEVLRMWSPVWVRTRRASTDVQLGGVDIAEGDRVHPVIGAAHRDPESFDPADEVDLDRAKLRSHLGFYLGARYCAGAPLARTEMTEFTRSFLHHFPRAGIDPDYPAPVFEGLTYRAFRPIHLLVDSAANS